MFNSEMIVGLWFVPVVLFILIPLSMLGIWTVLQFAKKVIHKTERVQETVKETLNESKIEALHPKMAA